MLSARCRQVPALLALGLIFSLCVGGLFSCARVPAGEEQPASGEEAKAAVKPEPPAPEPVVKKAPPVVKKKPVKPKPKPPAAPVPAVPRPAPAVKNVPSPVRPVPVRPAPVPPKPLFGMGNVESLARKLALKPYSPPKSVPHSLRSMSFEQWKALSFRDERSLWRQDNLPFEAQFFHPGSIYEYPVRIHMVDGDTVGHLPYSPDLFVANGMQSAAEPGGMSLDFAGLKVLSAGEGPASLRRIASFLGATYFCAAAKDGIYGTSALGLTVNTAIPGAEEFPRFCDFWLVKPAPGAASLTLYALMDSPSITGAYSFVLTPGRRMTMDVSCILFFRTGASVKKIGIAPLAGMFLSGKEGEVHDADSLLFERAEGRLFLSPLENPRRLDVLNFDLANPRGFGLMQREGRPAFYQTSPVPFEKRPSVWVTPKKSWGKGHLELVEIPTNTGVNKNIVVSWVPDQPRVFSPEHAAPRAWSYAYRLTWLKQGDSLHKLGIVEKSSTKLAAEGDRVTFTVDFSGESLNAIPADMGLSCPITLPPQTALLDKTLTKNPETGGWRLTFTASLPKEEGLLQSILPTRSNLPPLRFSALLYKGDNLPEPLTEIWNCDLRR